MITFTFSNGGVATMRTSGTEPKIKYYTELCAAPGNRWAKGEMTLLIQIMFTDLEFQTNKPIVLAVRTCSIYLIMLLTVMWHSWRRNWMTWLMRLLKTSLSLRRTSCSLKQSSTDGPTAAYRTFNALSNQHYYNVLKSSLHHHKIVVLYVYTVLKLSSRLPSPSEPLSLSQPISNHTVW